MDKEKVNLAHLKCMYCKHTLKRQTIGNWTTLTGLENKVLQGVRVQGLMGLVCEKCLLRHPPRAPYYLYFDNDKTLWHYEYGKWSLVKDFSKFYFQF